MYEGMIMVTTDMSLALVSVLLNLMVLNALREKESLLSKTHNLILANICCANLVSQFALGSSHQHQLFLWVGEMNERPVIKTHQKT